MTDATQGQTMGRYATESWALSAFISSTSKMTMVSAYQAPSVMLRRKTLRLLVRKATAGHQRL
jgi:hypothetical protein